MLHVELFLLSPPLPKSLPPSESIYLMFVMICTWLVVKDHELNYLF